MPGGQKGGHNAALLDELPARRPTEFRAATPPTLPRRIFAPAGCALAQRELQAVQRCSRSPAARGTEIFISAVEYLLFKTTRELAFQNLCLRANELVCGSAATGCHAAEEPQRRLDTTRHCVCVCVCMCVCVRARAR